MAIQRLALHRYRPQEVVGAQLTEEASTVESMMISLWTGEPAHQEFDRR